MVTQWGDDLPTVIEAFRAGDDGALAEVYAPRLDTVPRQVLHLAPDDGLGHAQIAQHLGLPPAAVRDHLQRSLLTLRQRLEVPADAH